MIVRPTCGDLFRLNGDLLTGLQTDKSAVDFGVDGSEGINFSVGKGEDGWPILGDIKGEDGLPLSSEGDWTFLGDFWPLSEDFLPGGNFLPKDGLSEVLLGGGEDRGASLGNFLLSRGEDGMPEDGRSPSRGVEGRSLSDFLPLDKGGSSMGDSLLSVQGENGGDMGEALFGGFTSCWGEDRHPSLHNFLLGKGENDSPGRSSEDLLRCISGKDGRPSLDTLLLSDGDG